MPPRRILLAANWKMNPPPQGAFDKTSPYRMRDDMDVVVLPTFLDIDPCLKASLVTGGQWGYPAPLGAFTGDVSMAMLKERGCTYVLCGHSERRKTHGETNEIVGCQTRAALRAGLQPIICIGETLEERDAGRANDVVHSQMKALPLDAALTLAYEPVWAIGTGKTALPEQAQDMHAFLRSLLPKSRQGETRIIYGGSLKSVTAADILRKPDIDGGLIGGASLTPAEFGEIVSIAAQIALP